MKKRVLCFVLALLLVFSVSGTVFATEETENSAIGSHNDLNAKISVPNMPSDPTVNDVLAVTDGDPLFHCGLYF